MSKQILVAEFLRTQAAWRLARSEADPVAAARCAAALLDAAAFAASLTEEDADLVRMAHRGCFREQVFDPGPRGVTLTRSWQYSDLADASPRDLIAALATAAVAVHGSLPQTGRPGSNSAYTRPARAPIRWRVPSA